MDTNLFNSKITIKKSLNMKEDKLTPKSLTFNLEFKKMKCVALMKCIIINNLK